MSDEKKEKMIGDDKGKRRDRLDFVIFSIVIICMSVALLFITNFTNTQENIRNRQVQAKLATISDLITHIDNDFKAYIEIIESVNVQDKKMLDVLFVVAEKFSQSRELISAYAVFDAKNNDGVFFDGQQKISIMDLTFHNSMNVSGEKSPGKVKSGTSINGKTFSDSSDYLWITLYSSSKKMYYPARIMPVFTEGEYRGFVALLLDVEKLQNEIIEVIPSAEDFLLVDENNNPLIVPTSQSVYEFTASQAQVLSRNEGSHSEVLEVMKLGNVDNKKWSSYARLLPNSYIMVYAEPISNILFRHNLLIMAMLFSVLIFTGLVQYSRRLNSTVFDLLSNRLMSRYISSSSHFKVNGNKVLLILHLGYFGAVLFTVASEISSFENIQRVQMYGVVLLFIAALFIPYAIKELSSKMAVFISICALLLPLTMHLLQGGFDGRAQLEIVMGGTLIWMLPGMIFGLFWLDRVNARRLFYFYVTLLFADTFFEVFVLKSPLGGSIFAFMGSMFFLGFALFAALELYVNRSVDNYNKLDNVFKQLRDTQSLLVQREKMGTLGQLIAGIAHEINTPIGAIKASSESLSSAVIPTCTMLLEQGERLTPEDREAFYRLVDMAMVAINEMKGTIELRKSKAQLRTYLESVEIENHREITDLLGRLEICEVEKIESNLDMFKRPNIVEIIRMVNSLTPLITGTQTILFATGKVSKIVFALKSYVHNSQDMTYSTFDLPTNIETVLVLCYNQIKKGITVVKEFEEVPELFGNPDELGQVWTNIIQNSIYALNEVGTLTIGIKNLPYDRVLVTIADTGVGIKPDNLSKIFEPLFTTKPLGEGSGLGLDICKKIIVGHGGKINVESIVGEGTTFYIELPLKALEREHE